VSEDVVIRRSGVRAGPLPQAWAAGISAEAPDCYLCTWVWSEGAWWLKFLAANCAVHARLAEQAAG